MKNRIFRSYTVSTISIALVLFVLGSIGYATTNLFTAAKEARAGVVMIVELKEGLSEELRDSIGTAIKAKEIVTNVQFVSKEEKIADEEFRRTFDVDIVGTLKTNPLPDSFDVTLSKEADNQQAVTTLAEQIRAIEGVDYVSYPEQLLPQIHRVISTMQLLMLLFGGAMLVISLVLLNNTIRLTIFARREAINTMKLVGATRWFIIRPFVRHAALQGFVAGIIATLLFVGVLFGLNHTLPQMGILEELQFIGIVAAAMVGAGVVVATLFTYFAVNRFVKIRSNKIYMY